MISEICIYTLADESVDLVLSHQGHLEAPNWRIDGSGLVVNGGGLIFDLCFASKTLTAIDTGFAQRCNNDHGLSPDGTLMAVSDSTVHGASCVYVLPAGGGTPRAVTDKTPSYWHGWSPDGTRLAYVASRADGPYALYTISLQGGDETCLSQGFDHVDGPDYSPDGEWVWFNGEVDGRVDIWRIHPDGTGAQRMTHGDSVDWFPHPSPDGAKVVYLAYPPGTQGHPAGKDVALQILPAEGGEPVELLRFNGGQGTINVPSWAPDSTAFAFVRYLP